PPSLLNLLFLFLHPLLPLPLFPLLLTYAPTLSPPHPSSHLQSARSNSQHRAHMCRVRRVPDSSILSSCSLTPIVRSNILTTSSSLLLPRLSRLYTYLHNSRS